MEKLFLHIQGSETLKLGTHLNVQTGKLYFSH